MIMFILVTLVAFMASIIITIYLYYALPKRIVNRFPKRFFKSDPNWIYFVEKSGEITRVIPGQNWVLAGDNLNDARDMEIKPRKDREEPTGGGRPSYIVALFEDWIFSVTGYRVAALTFTDLWNAAVKEYELGRNKVLDEYKDKTKDLSNHIIAAPQIYKTKVKDLETTRMFSTAGSEKEQAERIPVDIEIGFAFQVTNVLHITRGTNWKYFPFIFEILSTAVQDAVKTDKLGFDDIIGEKGRDAIIKYVLALNKSGYTPTSDEQREIVRKVRDLSSNYEVKDDDITTLTKDENQIGTSGRYGFKFTQILVGDINPNKDYAIALRAQQEARLKTEALITAATLGVTLAEKELTIAETNARAAVAVERTELETLNTNIRSLREKGGLGSEDTTAVVVARERRKAIERFSGSTLVLTEGGQQAPVVVPVGNTTKNGSRGATEEGQ